MATETPNPFTKLFSDFLAANPTYAKIIQYVAAAGALILKIPDWLVSAGVNMPTVLPSPWSNILAGVAVVIALIAQLPNKEPEVPVTPEVPAELPKTK